VQAQAGQAQRDRNRNAELLSAGLVARSAFEQTDSSLDVAEATVKSARVALDRAKRNLEYTNIYAPIDGVVVERNVDLGQTVAASLSTPQLFLIANDLTNMQILAKVGESDIAGIHEGQPVKFTVSALPKETFEGTVKQVRLQSATTENVVSYDVVVSVANAQQKLLPGMTARVKFLTQSAKDVLKVANAALRFRPTTASAAANGRTRGGSTLFTVDEKGLLVPIRVKTGVTDGTTTEVRGAELKEGMKVVAGTVQPAGDGTTTSPNPFQSTGTTGGGGGNRGGGGRAAGGM
jgi:HlyD family secretion protein